MKPWFTSLALISLVFNLLPGSVQIGKNSIFKQPAPPPAVSSPDSRLAQDYVEDFSTNSFKYYTQFTSWDTAMKQVSLLPYSGGAHREPDVVPLTTDGAILVWSDLKNNNADGNWDVYAQRLDADGNQMWRHDLRVNSDNGTSYQGVPLTAADNQGNVVVGWIDERDPNQGSIYLQKISPYGTKLWAASDVRANSPNSFRIGYSSGAWAMAIDTQNRLWVAWQAVMDDRWDQAAIYCQVFDTNGSRLWTSEVQVSRVWIFGQPANYNTTMGINIGPDGIAVVSWAGRAAQEWGIFAQRVSLEGALLWPSEVKVNAESLGQDLGNPQVVVDSQNQAVVVWRRGPMDPLPNVATSAILAQKLDTSGEKLWAGDVRVNLGDQATFRGHPRTTLASDDRVMVVWDDSTRGFGTIDCLAELLSPAGTLLWPEAEWRANPEGWNNWNMKPVVKISGATAWLTWDANDIYVRPVKFDSLTDLWPVPVLANEVDGKHAQGSADIARIDDSRALVIWQDFQYYTIDIYAQIVNVQGDLLWNPRIPVSDTDTPRKRLFAQAEVNSDGDALVVWEDEKGGIYGQVLDSSGNHRWIHETQLSPGGVQAYNPTVDAFADGSFLLTYSVRRMPNSNLWDVFAQRINSDGAFLWNQALRVNTSDYLMYEPDLRNRPQGVVDALGHVVVAWRGDNGAGDNVFLHRFSPDGNSDWPLDLRVGLSPYETPGYFENTILSLEASGAIYIAVASWQNENHGIAVKKYSLDGSPEWPTAAWAGQSSGGNPFWGNPNLAILPDGGVLVSWDDEQNSRNIYLQKIDPDGAPQWPRAPLNSNFVWPLRPALSSLMGNSFLIAWNDERTGDSNVYFQKIDTNGTKPWALDRPLIPFELFYRPQGRVVSRQVDTTNEVIPRATLNVTQTLNGGMIRYYLSNNGGTNWEEVVPGIRHPFSSAGNDLRWRADFIASSGAYKTPILSKVNIRYVDNSAGDIYEPDDYCDEAQPIGTDGALQQHTFYQTGDGDWAWFTPKPGTTYVIQTSGSQAKADTIIYLYTNCQDDPLLQSDNSLGQDARLTYNSPDAKPVYLRVANVDPTQFGDQTGYDLSVRTSSSQPLVIIVAGKNENPIFDSNIQYSADTVYRVFHDKGVPKDRIRYLSHDNHDVDHNGQNDDILSLSGPESVRNAIEDWAPQQRLGPGVPFYLYLVDHGIKDAFFINGDYIENQLHAEDLNLWLSNLEIRTGADQINLIIEACNSGSFISNDILEPGTLSGRNRVIITSTDVKNGAWPSLRGTAFSDEFWTAVSENQNLEAAFTRARDVVQILHPDQHPWLDDNGDSLYSNQDGSLARNRGLAGTLSSSAPAILQASVQSKGNGQAILQARIRDDVSIQEAWAVVVPPGFVPPPPNLDGTFPPLNLPILMLQPVGDDWYSFSYPLPEVPGFYQFVIYATDDDNYQAMPYSLTICSRCSSVYLPMLSKP